jgi:hypothetical protein
MDAGTISPGAGAYSPLVVNLRREDGSQQFSSVGLTLPPGLSGRLAALSYCPEHALAAARANGGVDEQAAPSCPATARIGSAILGVGAGTTPYYASGQAYLAGPYRGAPISLAIVTPAVAGPFDLGTIVVRIALYVDAESAQITVKSDSIPAILKGIPLDVRSIAIRLDRPNFTLNPTNCDPMAVAATVNGAGGAASSLSNRFQVGGCAGLGFKPELSVGFSGAPTPRGGHPEMRAVLRARPGDANIGGAAIVLPKTEYLDNSHIQTICTRARFAIRSCPTRSIYGYAKAWSPLLDEPLRGPVYLRSSDGKLPDLVAALDGQIRINLVGHIDSVRGRIRNTFAALPDVPVSKFELTMKGGRRGLLVNNTQLCRAAPRAGVFFRGQNGKTHRARPAVKVGCGVS